MSRWQKKRGPRLPGKESLRRVEMLNYATKSENALPLGAELAKIKSYLKNILPGGHAKYTQKRNNSPKRRFSNQAGKG